MTTIQIVGISLRLLPALVWAVAGTQALRFLLVHRPPSMLYRLFPLMAASVTAGFLIGVVYWLGGFGAEPPGRVTKLLYLGNDLFILTALAVFRHMVRYLPVPEEPPSRAWLAGNYGSAAAVGLLAITFPVVIPAPTFEQRLLVYRAIYVSYELAILVLCMRALARIARRGGWRPGGGVIALRYVDVALLAAAGLAIAGALVLIGRQASAPHLWLMVDGVIGIAVTLPIAARFLGETVRVTAFLVLAAAATAAAFLAAGALAGVVAPGDRQLLQLGSSTLLLFVVMLLQPRINETVDALFLRTSRRRRQVLQSFVHELSPELGTVECCRRAVAEAVRVEQLRGAAVILRGGEAVTAGEIDLGRVLDVWPTGEAQDELPPQVLGDYGLHGLPLALREAFSETSIVATMPIASPRARHGHLLLSTGLLRAYFPRDDADTLVAFTDQLALVLDASELLERAVAVERSLAHAEKLALIGELAARIAHEIRNPVTAAKSLAQQLAREPDAPFAEEHELILGELGRVERLVADLLRFSRREQLRREPTDVAALARETADAFRTRLDGSHVTLDVRADGAAVAEVDRDKMRQVLLNLVENALDALAGRERGTVTIAVARDDGRVTIGVRDDGPGVDVDALPHLFEPFFSLKPHGTGLGLAIVKRIVEAHGGRVTATPALGSGLAFCIEVPLA
ncbi:MAG: ATP-binding protein [Thermodesulfobacteriota bacterium]